MQTTVVCDQSLESYLSEEDPRQIVSVSRPPNFCHRSCLQGTICLEKTNESHSGSCDEQSVGWCRGMERIPLFCLTPWISSVSQKEGKEECHVSCLFLAMTVHFLRFLFENWSSNFALFRSVLPSLWFPVRPVKINCTKKDWTKLAYSKQVASFLEGAILAAHLYFNEDNFTRSELWNSSEFRCARAPYKTLGFLSSFMG